MRRHRDHYNVAEPHHPVLRAIHVDLGGRAEHGDGRHEAGEQRQRHGQHAHLSVGEQELPRRLLLAAGAAVKQPDAGRDGQHEQEDGIVPAGEHRDAASHDMREESVASLPTSAGGRQRGQQW